MKTKTCVLFFVLFCFSFALAQGVKTKEKKADETILSTKTLNTTASANDSVVFRDNDGNALIKITDEGTTGSITIPLSGSAPSSTTNKLYNVGSTLFFNGSAVGSGGGVTSLGGLSDVIFDGSSLFLGSGAGISDDGTDNRNTAVGFSTLHSNTTGVNNTANGYAALYTNTTGYG